MRIIFAFLLISLFFVFGCLDKQNYKDCGYDKECFEKALKTCAPAKLDILEGNDIDDLKIIGKTSESFFIDDVNVQMGDCVITTGFAYCYISKDKLVETKVVRLNKVTSLDRNQFKQIFSPPAASCGLKID